MRPKIGEIAMSPASFTGMLMSESFIVALCEILPPSINPTYQSESTSYVGTGAGAGTGIGTPPPMSLTPPQSAANAGATLAASTKPDTIHDFADFIIALSLMSTARTHARH